MGKISTTLMILIVTVIALGLTVYEERLEAENTHNKIVVEGTAPNDYKMIKVQVDEQ